MKIHELRPGNKYQSRKFFFSNSKTKCQKRKNRKPIGNSLQRLQNRAAHIILRKAMTEEAFKMLEWVDLETQRKAHEYISVFKCLNDLVPPYLSNYFIRNHTYAIRQRNDIHLPNPKLTLGKNTFRFSGAVLFNDLSTLVKEATSLSIFKHSLGFHFSH